MVLLNFGYGKNRKRLKNTLFYEIKKRITAIVN